MVLKDKDLKILCRLRNNARENLTKMSRKTSIPVSTIYDTIKKYEGNLIRKNTVLLDYKQLGYDLRVNFLIKIQHQQHGEAMKEMRNHSNVNNLYKINNGLDFLIEALFKDMDEFNRFREGLLEIGLEIVKEFFVLEEIKREEFMSNEHLNIKFLNDEI